MGRLDRIIEGLSNFESNIEGIVMDEIMDHSEELEEMNRDQMLEGIDSYGNPIRPKYSEDPFFKTAEAARKYAEWKMRISPRTGRDIDTPNLFINGFYHSGIKARLADKKIYTSNTSNFGMEVTSTFSTAEGIAPDNIAILAEKYVAPKIIQELKNILK